LRQVAGYVLKQSRVAASDLLVAAVKAEVLRSVVAAQLQHLRLVECCLGQGCEVHLG